MERNRAIFEQDSVQLEGEKHKYRLYRLEIARIIRNRDVIRGGSGNWYCQLSRRISEPSSKRRRAGSCISKRRITISRFLLIDWEERGDLFWKSGDPRIFPPRKFWRRESSLSEAVLFRKRFQVCARVYCLSNWAGKVSGGKLGRS